MNSLQDALLSPRDATEETVHPSSTLHGQNTQRMGQKKLMTPGSSAVRCNKKASRFLRLFTELVQIYCARTEKSLKFSAHVAYSGHGVWLSSAEKRNKYLDHHWYTPLGLLPFGIVEVPVEDGGPDVEKSLSM